MKSKSKLCKNGIKNAPGRRGRRPLREFIRVRGIKNSRGGASPSPRSHTVPVTVSVAVPGLTVYAPVSVFCVMVAAGTVTAPATVENTPVASS